MTIENVNFEYKSKFGDLLKLEERDQLNLMLKNVVDLLKIVKLTEVEVHQMAKFKILEYGNNKARGNNRYKLRGVHRAVVATWARNNADRPTNFIEISRNMNGLMFKYSDVLYNETIGQTVINSLYSQYLPNTGK